MSDPLTDMETAREAGPRILVDHAGGRDTEPQARSLVETGPGAFACPDDARELTALPDALVWVGGPADGLPPAFAVLRERARTARIALPLVIVGDRMSAGFDVRAADVIVPGTCPPTVLQERIAEAVRQSLRMEEARLRRSAFGRDPFAPDTKPLLPEEDAARRTRIPVLVAGNGSRIAAALTGGLSAIELVGCLSPDAALARLGEHPFRMLVADLPEARALELVAALRRDPRHIALPVMVLAQGQPAATALLEAGASDVVTSTAPDDELGARCRMLLRSGARRQRLRRQRLRARLPVALPGKRTARASRTPA